MRPFVLMSVGLFCLAASPAASVSAQATDERAARCENKQDSFSFALQVAGCTALIDTNRLTNDGAVFAYFNRGRAFARNKDYERAVADFTSALRIQPTHVQSLILRAVTYRVLKDPEHAKADLAEALRLDPRNSVALSEMEFWRRAQGQ